MQIAPYIVAKNAGQACKQDKNAVYESSLLAAHAKRVHGKGHDIFKDGNYRGKAGKGHKQEKQGAPDPSARHIDKYIGQSDKNKLRARTCFHSVAEAGRKNDKTCHNGNERI